jgi:hypothetical protein
MQTLNGNGHPDFLPANIFHPAIQAAAKAISFLFHPLFIPVYISGFLMYNTPLFTGLDARDKAMLLLHQKRSCNVLPCRKPLCGKVLNK